MRARGHPADLGQDRGGGREVLEAIVERIPAPDGRARGAEPRALIFDSEFDQYRGVVAYVRMVDGAFRKREPIRAMQAGTEAEIDEIGFFAPEMAPAPGMDAGEVGYVITGLKDVAKLRVGDTLTARDGGAHEALPGYREVKPVVFCGLFPIDTDRYEDLREALERLALNDAALSYEPETSDALGFGFRCGFLGLLHMDIVRERLEREYDLELLATTPNVSYEVNLIHGDEPVEVHSPTDMPDPGEIESVAEPFIRASIITPTDYVGAVMELCQKRRGDHVDMHYLSPERVQIRYDLPLAEIVLDFYDQLKSRTSGYASLDYEPIGNRVSDLVKLDVLLAGDRVDALSVIVHRDEAPVAGQAARRAPAEDDPAPALRRAGPGGDGVARARAGDGEGAAQGCDREALRWRRDPQAQAAREAEEGQEADEAGRPGRGAPGGVPVGAGARAVSDQRRAERNLELLEEAIEAYNARRPRASRSRTPETTSRSFAAPDLLNTGTYQGRRGVRAVDAGTGRRPGARSTARSRSVEAVGERHAWSTCTSTRSGPRAGCRSSMDLFQLIESATARSSAFPCTPTARRRSRRWSASGVSEDTRVELIREGFEAWEAGDVEATLALYDPEIVVYAPPEIGNAGHLPRHRGVPGVDAGLAGGLGSVRAGAAVDRARRRAARGLAGHAERRRQGQRHQGRARRDVRL